MLIVSTFGRSTSMMSQASISAKFKAASMLWASDVFTGMATHVELYFMSFLDLSQRSWTSSSFLHTHTHTHTHTKVEPKYMLYMYFMLEYLVVNTFFCIFGMNSAIVNKTVM